MRPALLALLLAGCYTPQLHDSQFTCSDQKCPVGYTCACGLCTAHPPATCGDGGLDGGGDMSVGDMSGLGLPCANGGARSAMDPMLPAVAFCPAAWQVAGLLGTATPCARHPGSNGMSGGTKCTAADNCGAGWHICTSQTELAQRGFTVAHCAMITAQELYVTVQPGAPPMPDGGPPNGPPMCSSSMHHIVFGCGTTGGGADSASCTLLNHTLTDMPMNGTDECAQQTNGAFSCGPNGLTTMGQFEIDVVTKAATAGGGVLCCTD